MKRWLAIGGGVVVVVILLVAGVAIFVLSNLNSLIESAVAKFGTQVTQTEVSLAEADVSPTSGDGALRGLLVANPEGFQTPSAFELGEISIGIDIASVTTDTIVVRHITIVAPQVTYELGARGGSNIDALRRNIEESLGGRGGDGTSDSGAPADDKDGGKKLIVEELTIREGRVNVSAALLRGQSRSAALPAIHLTNLGKDGGGATPEQIVAQIAAAVTQNIGKAVASMNLPDVIDEAGKAGEAVKKALEGSTDDVKGAVEGAGEALKGILNR